MRKAARGIVFKDNQLLVVKRNKFGQQYYTLPGGGVDIGETPEQTLSREMDEETSVKLGHSRLVFTEQAGNPFGLQYVYLCDYLSGNPRLNPNALEVKINQLGKNLYEPMWLPISELPTANFLSERLKQAILDSIKNGFPEKPKEIT